MGDHSRLPQRSWQTLGNEPSAGLARFFLSPIFDRLVERNGHRRSRWRWPDGYHRQQLGIEHALSSDARAPTFLFLREFGRREALRLVEAEFGPDLKVLASSPLPEQGPQAMP